VGWGDTYRYYLVDQWIDLGTSSLPDGQYILRSVADPSNLEEQGQDDLVINTPFGRDTLVCLITKIARMFRYYNWTQHWTQQLIAGRHPPPSPGGASRSSDPSVRRNAMSSRKKTVDGAIRRPPLHRGGAYRGCYEGVARPSRQGGLHRMNLAAAPGYALDLAGDPCIILRNPDGALVARFPHNIDPDELRRAAEEDRQQRG
jgi:hypothetical protein